MTSCQGFLNSQQRSAAEPGLQSQPTGHPPACARPLRRAGSLPAHVWLTATAFSPSGPAPSEEAGTKARFPLSSAMEEGAWTAVVMDQQDGVLSLQLSTPANAPVGLYRLTLEASTGYQGSSFVLGHFTLLFNTWCPGEPCSRWRGDAGSWQGWTTQWHEAQWRGGMGLKMEGRPLGSTVLLPHRSLAVSCYPPSCHTGRDRHLEANAFPEATQLPKRPHPASEAHVFPEPRDLGVQVSGVHSPSQEWGVQGMPGAVDPMPGSGSWGSV